MRLQPASKVLKRTIVFLAVVTLVSPSIMSTTATAKTGKETGQKVKTTQIYRQGKIVCGYTKSGKSRKYTWKPGIAISPKRFQSHSEKLSRLKKDLSIQKKLLRTAQKNKKLSSVKKHRKLVTKTTREISVLRKRIAVDQNVCSSLTSIRFNTRNIVGLTIVDSASTESTSVRKSSKQVRGQNFKSGLAGVNEDGSLVEVIQPIDSSLTPLPSDIEVVEIYESPDGSIVTYYGKHPDDCLLSKIPFNNGPEECIIKRRAIAPYLDLMRTYDGYMNSRRSLVQFDNNGSIYIEAFKHEQCDSQDTGKYNHVTNILKIQNDSLSVMPKEPCYGVRAWAVTPDGTVFSESNTHYWPLRNRENELRISKWDGENMDVVAEKIALGTDGILALASNHVIVTPSFNIEGTLPRNGLWFADSSSTQIQPWLDDEIRNPVHSFQKAFPQNVDPDRPTVHSYIIDDVVIAENKLFGRGCFDRSNYRVIDSTIRSCAIMQFFPEVQTLENIDGLGELIGHTKNWFVVSAPEYHCALRDEWYPGACRDELTIINKETGKKISLRQDQMPLAITTMTSSNTGDSALLHGVRITDKKTFVGRLQPAADQLQITWTEVPTLDYRTMRLIK